MLSRNWLSITFLITFLSISINSFSTTNTEDDSLLLEIEKLESDTSKVNSLLNYATKNITSNYKKAIKLSNQALIIAKKLDYYKGIAESYIISGSTYNSQGNYINALEYFFSALKIYEENRNLYKVGLTYNNIGTIYNSLNDNQKSIIYYQKAVSIFNQIDNKEGLAYTTNNIGNIHYVSKQFDMAIDNYTTALKYNEEINNLEGIATGYQNIANIYSEKEEYNNAFNYLFLGLKISKKIKNSDRISLILGNIGNLYYTTKDYNNAILYLSESLDIAREKRLLVRIKYASERLYNIHSVLKQYKEAIHYLEETGLANDSINNKIFQNKLLEFKVQHNYNEEQAISLDELLKKINKKKKQLILTSASFLFLILLFVFLFYIERQKCKNAKLMEQNLQADLNLKNKDIIKFAIHITEKNAFIDRIKEKINTVKNDLKINENIQSLNDISVFVSQSMNLTRDNQDFHMYINGIYQDFFNNLKEKYPNLTYKESRLAALINLDLSSKEIASVFNISTKSVEMNRYRLRKKLNVAEDQKLQEFIKDITS